MAAEADYSTYKDALIVLGAAGVAVPFMNRYRISPVLGFLFAGALLSPNGLGLLSDALPALNWVTVSSPERVEKFAELGVVFLLFLIGLELSYERLLTMRRLVFGLGALQVLSCGLMMGALALWLGEPPTAAIVIGAALALSSTAIVIEVLAGQKRLASATGRTSFAILLFQDLAVIPILFLIGVLDPKSNGSVGGGIATALAQAAATLFLIVTIGRYLLQPLFRLVAQTKNQDMFIAATLFVAVGTSFATAVSGLSMALGAFVAGLLLAETEYRRAVEATIEPIKSLMIGVFFFSVGLSLDLGVLFSEPFTITALVLSHLAMQGVVIYLLARIFGVQRPAAIESAALLAPGGEFAFVVLTLALSAGLVSPETTKVLLTSVALSMAMIPILGATARRYNAAIAPRAQPDPELTALPSLEKPVTALVVGYGRVGQLIGEMLETHGVSYVAVDNDARLVAEMRRKEKPVYFGDVRHLDFLERCGLGSVRATIITIHTQSAIDSIVTAIRAVYPKLVIVARAKDATHARHLYGLGVTDAVPETIEASLQLSEAALVGLGVPTGLVIASIHEKRDDFRAELQGAAKAAGKATRAFPGRKRI